MSASWLFWLAAGLMLLLAIPAGLRARRHVGHGRFDLAVLEAARCALAAAAALVLMTMGRSA